MILLQVQRVARHFGSDILFEDLFMEIKEGARIALVGRNGAGKSTLLKIIAGIEEPDQGSISKTKDVTIGYLSQHTGLQSERTIWDEMLVPFQSVIHMEKEMRDIEKQLQSTELIQNETLYKEALARYDHLQHAFHDANGYGYQSEIRSVLHGFSFYEEDYDSPIDQLSGGQKTRLALARLLLEKKDLLILDEPTNHLDIETMAWLEDYLQAYRGALLIVSHDRYFLNALVNEVYEISRQKMTHYPGNYTRYIEQKAVLLEKEWKDFEKQQKKIDALEDFVHRNIARASTTKRAQSRRKQLEKMDRMDKPMGDEKSAHFSFHPEQESGMIVLQSNDLAVGYDNTPLSSDISLDIRKQDAIALVGPNGIGKSTLLKTLVGTLPSLEGEVTLGTKVDLGYYDQEQSDLNSTKSVLLELWDDHPTTPEKDIRTLLGSFLFTGEDVEKSVSSLSGGEKARLALSKLAMQRDNFLVLDEPTNHLDIDSKEVLENALIEFEGTILFVSHDRYFINRIATKVVELSENGATMYLGDYDYYVQKKADLEELKQIELDAIAEKSKSPSKNSEENEPISDQQERRMLSKDMQKRQRQLERQIAVLEEEMEESEEKIDALETQLSLPDVYHDHVKAAQLGEEIAELKHFLDQKLHEWEEKSLELDDIESA